MWHSTNYGTRWNSLLFRKCINHGYHYSLFKTVDCICFLMFEPRSRIVLSYFWTPALTATRETHSNRSLIGSIFLTCYAIVLTLSERQVILWRIRIFFLPANIFSFSRWVSFLSTLGNISRCKELVCNGRAVYIRNSKNDCWVYEKPDFPSEAFPWIWRTNDL